MEKNNRSLLSKVFRRPLGGAALFIILLICFLGVYAPFFASSKPLAVYWKGWHFPLFDYLFFPGFFTKRIDLFFNILMVVLPLFLISFWLAPKKSGLKVFGAFFLIQSLLFLGVIVNPPSDPARNSLLYREREKEISDFFLEKKGGIAPNENWDFDLKTMGELEKLNLIVHYYLMKEQYEKLKSQIPENKQHLLSSTLWANYQRSLHTAPDEMEAQYLEKRDAWLKKESQNIQYILFPFFRPFHWEDDAGGSSALNQAIRWDEVTRINRKDLMAALLFGIRISLVVGIVSVALALIIGIPIGAWSGFYGGWKDILICRLLEIWESMPTFFMLLLVISMTQSKSIFIVIAVIGLFGWTGFARYVRGEFFKQRKMSYVEACKALGFGDIYTMFTHILPNAIQPVIILLPFAVMGAITSEAGLSFLGLGEVGSASWGVLMDEGRSAFPAETYLLWPPAVLLTVLLIAVALLGDVLRDLLDPRLK